MAPSPKRKIQALGPGLLTFGEAGTSLDISAQVTSGKIDATLEQVRDSILSNM